MTEFHDLAAAYVLGGLADMERRQFEAHLAECMTCQSEAAGGLQVTDALAESLATPPPPILRERVLDEVNTTPQVGQAAQSSSPTPARKRWSALALAAAAAVAAIATAVVLLSPGSTPTDEILASPDAVEIMVAEPVISGLVAVSVEQGRLVFDPSQLPDLGPGETFELWLIGPSGPEPAGLFTQRDAIVVEGVEAGQVLGLTIEPEGGSDVPTGEILMAVQLPS